MKYQGNIYEKEHKLIIPPKSKDRSVCKILYWISYKELFIESKLFKRKLNENILINNLMKLDSLFFSKFVSRLSSYK